MDFEFTKEELAKLQKLCKIACTQEEEEKLFLNIKNILGHFKSLQEANTEGVMGKHNVLESKVNVMAEDEVGELLRREDLLDNAPSHVGGMIRVPTVIQF